VIDEAELYSDGRADYVEACAAAAGSDEERLRECYAEDAGNIEPTPSCSQSPDGSSYCVFGSDVRPDVRATAPPPPAAARPPASPSPAP
jgi:hypothetical protein